MEVELIKETIGVSILLGVMVLAWRMLDWAWFTPKKLEKKLRGQEFKGNPYRFLVGDVKESAAMLHEAMSKPMEFNNDIGMLPAFAMCYDEMLSHWETVAQNYGSHEVDVFPAFDTLTFDVISRVAFGSNYDEGGKIFQLLKELMDLTTMVMRDFYIPGWRYLPTKTNKRMKEIDIELRSTLRKIVNNRVKAMEAGEESKEDLLGVLLDSNFKEIQRLGNKKNSGMSIEDVITECKLFYFAGQETTGILLTWTMVLLSKHPEWQDRARKEMQEGSFRVASTFYEKTDKKGRVRGKATDKPFFTRLSTKPGFYRVSMILFEVLRLYPPVIDVTKIVHEETKLVKLLIPPGVQIMLPSLMLHRNKKVWGDDALEFNPTRFAEGVASVTKNQVTYIPFTWGPRVCLGQNFALLQAKLGLAMILQRFTFDLSPTYKHAPIAILALQPQHGARVIYRQI
ncbi:hypothetical protein LguiB_023988 [Lonicera macranthoides]